MNTVSYLTNNKISTRRLWKHSPNNEQSITVVAIAAALGPRDLIVLVKSRLIGGIADQNKLCGPGFLARSKSRDPIESGA